MASPKKQFCVQKKIPEQLYTCTYQQGIAGKKNDYSNHRTLATSLSVKGGVNRVKTSHVVLCYITCMLR